MRWDWQVYAVLLLDSILLLVVSADFTCQDGADSCPDQGAQQHSSGGTIAAVVYRALNLRDADKFVESGKSDPYVELTCGASVAKTHTVQNSLSPVWDETIALGRHGSGDEIQLRVYDSDSGLEFWDDLLYETTLRVPFCSAFQAETIDADCTGQFDRDCDVLGSSWLMPSQPRCQESAWINLDGKDATRCEAEGAQDACLLLGFDIIPFQVAIEHNYLGDTAKAGVAGYSGELVGSDPGYAEYGKAYVDRAQLIDDKQPLFESLRGGIVIRTDSSQAATLASEPLVDISLSMECDLYICRWKPDSDAALDASPEWLSEGWELTAARLYLFGLAEPGDYMKCRKKRLASTLRNHYGGLESPPVTLYSNGVTGHEEWMYVAIALPAMDDEGTNDLWDMDLSVGTLWVRFFEYVPILAIFLFMGLGRLAAMKWQLVGVESSVAKAAQSGGTVLEALFVCAGQTESNVQLRSNIYFATLATKISLSLPLITLWAWGFATSLSVNPPAVGAMLLFLGTAFTLGGLAYRGWKDRGWLMTGVTLAYICLALLCIMLYCIVAAFIDPAVVDGGEPMSFAGLTAGFFTLNFLPLVALVFMNDHDIVESAKRLRNAMEEPDFSAVDSTKSPVGLDTCYTLSQQTVRSFRWANLMSCLFESGASTRYSLYGLSISFLFIYQMIAIAETNYAELALLNIVTLLTFDSVHYSLHRGSNRWTPGVSILIMASARCFIMAFVAEYWLIGYSLAFLGYGSLLVRSAVRRHLPQLSAQEAGSITFLSHDPAALLSCHDMAANPEIALGYLGLYFIFILALLAYTEPGTLPQPTLAVGSDDWPAYVIPLMSILVVIGTGLFEATFRAYELEKSGLLSVSLQRLFLWHPSVRLPMSLGLVSVTFVTLSGLFVWAATGSLVIFFLCMLVPPILLLAGFVYDRWKSNDFELVWWPPNDKMDAKYGVVQMTDTTWEGDALLLGGGGGGDGMTDTFEQPKDVVYSVRADTMGLPVQGTASQEASSGAPAPTLFGEGSLLLDGTLPDFEAPDLPLIGTLARSRGQETTIENEVASPVVEVPEYRRKYTRSPNEPSEHTVLKVGMRVSSALQSVPSFITKMKPKKMRYAKMSSNKVEPEESVSGLNDMEASNSNAMDVLDEDQLPDSHMGPQLVSELPLWRAALEGYLVRHEYWTCAAFGVLLGLILLLGLLLASETGWVGHVVWCSTYILLFTAIPAIKYINVYEIDVCIRTSLAIAAILHFLQCLLVFTLVLDSDGYQDNALAVLNVFIGYPMLTWAIFRITIAWDSERAVPEGIRAIAPDDGEELGVEGEDMDGGNHRRKLLVMAKRLFTFDATFLCCVVLWIWQAFVWGNRYVGWTLTIFVSLTALVALEYRAFRQRSSSHSVRNLFIALNVFMFVSFILGVSGAANVAYCLSVFFLIWMSKLCTRVGLRLSELDEETPILCSPWILPAFSFDAGSGLLTDETKTVSRFLSAIFVGVLWGMTLAALVQPVGIGIVLACIFLMAAATFCAESLARTPARFGMASHFLTPDMAADACSIARSSFLERQAEWEVTCDEWVTRKEPMERLPRPLPETAASIATRKEEVLRRLYFGVDHVTKEEYERSDGLFRTSDAAAEALLGGRGPLGLFGLWGLWYKVIQATTGRCKDNWVLRNFDSNGVKKMQATGHTAPSDPLLHALSRTRDDDEALAYAAREELRCMIHFQVLTLLTADARLQRESVLFRKFLRENMFKLRANGIAPPEDIFASESFASIDIGVVAIWISSLTREERQRFQRLRDKYSELQAERDGRVDAADAATQEKAFALDRTRGARGRELLAKQTSYMDKRRQERAESWLDSLSSSEAERFEILKPLWMKQSAVVVRPQDADLREKFEKHVLLEGLEDVVNAREMLNDIETHGRHCSSGQYGRRLQFCDPDFPPDAGSLGDVQAEGLASQWKVSLSANADIKLYDDGTEPDDVRQGVIRDDWLLSALSMLAAAPGASPGSTTEQIASLFVNHLGADGKPLTESEVGAYAVRLTRDGQALILLLDDFFPSLEPSISDEVNRGIASAHSRGMSELWVSLLEKAFAKFCGSYAALEQGSIPHALRDLTGCDTEEIFLSSAGRGLGKSSLWKKLRRFRKNGHIMGAGTASSELAESQMKETGLCFGSAYIVYEVQEIDGHRLLKLRNPPGDHDEWRGDWGDNSQLWTRRLRKLLRLVEDSCDNTFWMSFDDFCLAFQSLYICRWHDPDRWATQSVHGSWEFTEELDTAPGLPSKHQRHCQLQDNPQYILRVDMPVDVTITFTQLDVDLQPAALYVLLPASDSPAKARVEHLTRDIIYASTGQPSSERMQRIHCSLRSGEYTLMAAALMAGMEGSFRIDVTSDIDVDLEKLWPPADPDELQAAFDNSTLMGRIANQANAKLQKAANTAGDAINKKLENITSTPGTPTTPLLDDDEGGIDYV